MYYKEREGYERVYGNQMPVPEWRMPDEEIVKHTEEKNSPNLHKSDRLNDSKHSVSS